MSFFFGFTDELVKLADTNHPECGVPAVEVTPAGDSALMHERHTPKDVDDKNSKQREYHINRMPDEGLFPREGKFNIGKVKTIR